MTESTLVQESLRSTIMHREKSVKSLPGDGEGSKEIERCSSVVMKGQGSKKPPSNREKKIVQENLYSIGEQLNEALQDFTKKNGFGLYSRRKTGVPEQDES